MSKKLKKKRKQQPKKFPWLIVSTSVLLAAVAILVLVGPRQDYRSGMPAIGVDKLNINMGYVKLGQYRTIKIKVTNMGDGILRFSEQPYIEVVEGCCPPQISIGSMTLKPGQSTYVQTPKFMMHEGMDGKHDFAIHLKTNDPVTPELLVHVLSDWGP